MEHTPYEIDPTRKFTLAVFATGEFLAQAIKGKLTDLTDKHSNKKIYGAQRLLCEADNDLSLTGYDFSLESFNFATEAGSIVTGTYLEPTEDSPKQRAITLKSFQTSGYMRDTVMVEREITYSPGGHNTSEITSTRVSQGDCTNVESERPMTDNEVLSFAKDYYDAVQEQKKIKPAQNS